MVFFPSQFNKLGQSCKDLLKKNYDFNKTKFTVKHNGPDGLKLETGVESGKSTSGYTKVTSKLTNAGELEVKLGSAGVNVEATLDQLADGVEVVCEAALKTLNALPSGSVSATYVMDGFAAKAELSDDMSVTASAVIGHDGLSVGAQATLANGDIADYNVASQLQQNGVTLALVTSNRADNLVASFYQKLATGNLLGVEYSINNDKAEECNLAIGSQYQLDSATSLKSKINSCGCLAMALTHTHAASNVKVNFASSFDYANNFAVKDYGLGFTLGDF